MNEGFEFWKSTIVKDPAFIDAPWNLYKVIYERGFFDGRMKEFNQNIKRDLWIREEDIKQGEIKC